MRKKWGKRRIRARRNKYYEVKNAEQSCSQRNKATKSFSIFVLCPFRMLLPSFVFSFHPRCLRCVKEEEHDRITLRCLVCFHFFTLVCENWESKMELRSAMYVLRYASNMNLSVSYFSHLHIFSSCTQLSEVLFFS